MSKSERIFLCALLLIVFGVGYYASFLNVQANTTEENKYDYSFSELVNYVNNVENYLAKAMISKSSSHSADTLMKIWADSNLAISYMQNIPFDGKGSSRFDKIFKSS